MRLATIRTTCAIFTISILGGCGSAPHYLTLSGGYTKDNDAAGKLGYLINDVQGESPLPYEVFSVAATDAPAQDYTSGDDKLSSDAKSKIAAKVNLQANEQCKIGGNVDLGANNANAQDIKFAKEISPSATKWTYKATGNICCKTDGTVTPLCAKKSVIIGVYSTKSSVTATAGVDVEAGAQVTCSGATTTSTSGTGEVSVTVGANRKLSISSTGWNVVKVAPVESICATLGASQPAH